MSKIFTHPQLQRLKDFVSRTITQMTCENNIRKVHRSVALGHRVAYYDTRIKRVSEKIAKLERLQVKIKHHVSGNRFDPRKEFVQRELQSLRELLRDELRRLNCNAAYAKRRASELWKESHRGARGAEIAFGKMNAYRNSYRREKKRERGLIELLRSCKSFGEHIAVHAQLNDSTHSAQHHEKIDFDGIVADVFFFYYHPWNTPWGASSPITTVEHHVEDGYVNMIVTHERYPGRMFHVVFEHASKIPFTENATIFEVRPNLLAPFPAYEIAPKR